MKAGAGVQPDEHAGDLSTNPGDWNDEARVSVQLGENSGDLCTWLGVGNDSE